ncbi:MAG: proton-conducting transporter membrane subunit [Anaerolineales bacterium]|nr:proton-conducting transporter membrane subunit [Anaerolineales bacterium]
MSAPLIWILLPFLAGALILFFLPEKYSSIAGGTLAALLSLAALIFPIDTALLIGSLSIKISASVAFFGRSFVLTAADGALLSMIYGVAAFWLICAYALDFEKRFAALSLMIVALLTASIAVEPFLYASLLLEMAAMLAVPLLVPVYQKAGRGVVRFLVYQTLAMPFILFSGWALAGVEANPGDFGATLQSGAMLGLGFAFLFGVFPFYNWIPLLLEEVSPYVVGFLLWSLTAFTTIFALGFLDRYAWISASPQISSAIVFSGTVMVVSGGVFASMQKHIGRMMGYAAILETGLIVLAMGLRSPRVVDVIFLLLIPRGLELVVWAFALSIIKRQAYSLRLSEVRGLARKYPLAVSALIAAHLSVTGFPLLAGFPSRLALWQELAGYSLTVSFWVFLGVFGLLVAATRALAVFVMADENASWGINESWAQIIMLSLGVAGLFAIGIFPQILQPLLADLPALFLHLGR